MAAIWGRLDALAGRAVVGHFGSLCQITPRLTGDYTLGPDPDRPSIEVVGIFSLEPEFEDVRGQRVQGEFPGTTKFSLPGARVVFTAAEADKIGFQLEKGDLVVIPDARGHTHYSVAAVHPFDTGDVLVFLTQEAAP